MVYQDTGIWFTRTLACGLPGCWYVVYQDTDIWFTRTLVCGLPGHWYLAYQDTSMWSTRTLACGLPGHWYVACQDNAIHLKWSGMEAGCSVLPKWYPMPYLYHSFCPGHGVKGSALGIGCHLGRTIGPYLL